MGRSTTRFIRTEGRRHKESPMGKEKNSRKDSKKKPLKTQKEKRKEKNEKKNTRE